MELLVCIAEMLVSIAQDAKKYELKLFNPKWLVTGDMAHGTCKHVAFLVAQ